MAKTKESQYQEKLSKAKICSICYQQYEEFGNNASPINIGTCCNSCNNLVIIARLNGARAKKILDKVK